MNRVRIFDPFRRLWFEEDLDLPVKANGLVATHPFVDLHVHVRLGGVEGYDTLEKAALIGGFKTLVIQPNTSPNMENMEIFKLHERHARGRLIEFFWTASLFGELETGGKIVAYSTDGIEYSSRELESALSKKKPSLLFDHSQIYELGGRFYRGTNAPLSTRPHWAEAVAIYRTVLAGLEHGWKVFHIQHLSTKEGLEAIADLKRKAKVTCEVTPHHLLLTMGDIDGPDRKVNPPLASEEDRKALVEGVRKGVIDVLASDHAPHPSKGTDVVSAPFGSSSIEVAFSAYFTAIQDLQIVVEKMTREPLRVLGITSKLSKDGLVFIDPEGETVVDPSKFRSGGKSCALTGMRLRGRVVGLKLNGRWIHWDGEFLYEENVSDEDHERHVSAAV